MECTEERWCECCNRWTFFPLEHNIYTFNWNRNSEMLQELEQVTAIDDSIIYLEPYGLLYSGTHNLLKPHGSVFFLCHM